MLAAQIAVWISGGLLPRKARRKTAESFLQVHHSIAAAAYSGRSPQALHKAVESAIEHICRIATTYAPGWQTGLEHEHMRAAAEKLVREETNSERRQLISALIQHLERTWYQSAQG